MTCCVVVVVEIVVLFVDDDDFVNQVNSFVVEVVLHYISINITQEVAG